MVRYVILYSGVQHQLEQIQQDLNLTGCMESSQPNCLSVQNNTMVLDAHNQVMYSSAFMYISRCCNILVILILSVNKSLARYAMVFSHPIISSLLRGKLAGFFVGSSLRRNLCRNVGQTCQPQMGQLSEILKMGQFFSKFCSMIT